VCTLPRHLCKVSKVIGEDITYVTYLFVSCCDLFASADGKKAYWENKACVGLLSRHLINLLHIQSDDELLTTVVEIIYF